MVIYQKQIESTFDAVNIAVHEIIDVVKEQCKLDDKTTLFKISFMLREMLNNAVEHGNRFDKDKQVTCEVYCENGALTFTISDEGSGIDLTSQPFDMSEDHLLRERNRGHKTIQEMAFEVQIEGNKVIVILELNQEAKLWKKS